MKRLILMSLVVVLTAFPALAAERPVVAVTIAPQAWLVEALAGNLVQVETLVPAGSDPHTYEPKPSQMAGLARAALFLSIGLEFEHAWLPRLASASPGMRVVALDQGLEKLFMREHDHGHGHDHGSMPDPHVWTSPANMRLMAAIVARELAAVDPANASAFESSLLRLEESLGALDAEIAALLEEVRGGSFLVFHPSWGYFAAAYGLTQVPIEVGGSEPSPRELARIVAQAREMRARAIFVQPQSSTRSASVLAREIGAGLVVADPLAHDWDQNLLRVAAAFRDALR